MKLQDIKGLRALKDYCKRVPHTHPFPIDNNTPQLIIKSNNSGSISYVLFNFPIRYGYSHIDGFIYSYDTPIGLIMGYNLYVVPYKQFTFKSCTTSRLSSVLCRNNFTINKDALFAVCRYFKISLGWWY